MHAKRRGLCIEPQTKYVTGTELYTSNWLQGGSAGSLPFGGQGGEVRTCSRRVETSFVFHQALNPRQCRQCIDELSLS